MSVQVKKQTPSKKRRRRSHDALKKTKLNVCSKCKKPTMPYHVCRSCGNYKNKEAIKIRPNKEERKLLKTKKAKRS